MEAAPKADPEAGQNMASAEQLPLVESAGEMKPSLHAGVCSTHGGFRLFWCSTCRTWLCREGTLLDHADDPCEVIPMKDAISIFQREEEDAAAQLRLYRMQTFSLIKKGDELKAATQRLVKDHRNLMDDLQEEQEKMDTFFKWKEKSVPDLESVLRGSAVESVKSDVPEDPTAESGEDKAARSRQTFEVWYQTHKEQMTRLAKCLNATHTRKVEKIQLSISALQRLDIMAAAKPERSRMSGLRLTGKTLPVQFSREVLAKDPDMFSRGLILELTSGTFYPSDICNVLGKDNIECIEETLNIYVITVKDTAIRDHIAATFKSIDFRQGSLKASYPVNSACYKLHNIAPTPASVKGSLTGIPSFLFSRDLDKLQETVSDAFPLLEKVELRHWVWVDLNIQSGHMGLTSETDDLEALDCIFQSCNREVSFDIFTGKLTNLKAESQNKVVLPEKPFAQGFSFQNWSW